MSVKWIQGIVVSVLLLLLGACGGGEAPNGGDASGPTPVATITSPMTGSVYPEGSDISFTGTGEDIEGGALDGTSLAWSSDADGQLGTGETVSSMLSTGSHTITLEATDSGGATGTDTITITVNAAPVIDNMVTSPARVNVSTPTAINWSITDADGDTLTCDLDINADGSNEHTIDDCANNTSQIHTYAQTGDYQVRLTVTDNVNAPVQQVMNVTVMDLGAIPEVTVFSATPEAPETGDPVAFDWDVSDGDGDTLTCKLDVDADGSYDYTISDCASNNSQEHTYTQAGVYQVRLTVEDGANSPVQATIDLTVSSTSPVTPEPPGGPVDPPPPAANWSAPIGVYIPTTETYLEVQDSLPANWVITGLGFRAYGGAITTMLISASEVTATGLQGNMKRRSGSAPNNPLEVEANCPFGSVVTAVAMREKNGNITNLRLRCSRFVADTQQVDYWIFRYVEAVSSRAHFGAGYEIEFSFNNLVSFGDYGKVFLTGFGARDKSDSVENVWGQIQLLNP